MTLPMFHAHVRSTGPLAGSTVVVPAATSVIVPSRSSSAMRAPDELAGGVVQLEDAAQLLAWELSAEVAASAPPAPATAARAMPTAAAEAATPPARRRPGGDAMNLIMTPM